ncbi:MAG: sulfoxide reductase heme-binding subunit YedZ [Chloroflexi bacterium]|nr:sulfoxide reductase heme-binding subunit YedZ [Chloroflexota bacterium]
MAASERPSRVQFSQRPRAVPLVWLAPGIFVGALAPFVWIVLRARSGELGANPIAEVENELGLAALVLLVASLACTPARHLFAWSWPPRVRRELGLFAFFYAVLHFLVYLVLDQTFEWGAIVEDVLERPFITAGFLALVLLTPLAFTSTKASIRRLGFRRWQRVHQLAYVAGVMAVIHFIWRVKLDVTQPLLYAAVLGGLLAVRVAFWVRKRLASRPLTPSQIAPASPVDEAASS